MIETEFFGVGKESVPILGANLFEINFWTSETNELFKSRSLDLFCLDLEGKRDGQWKMIACPVLQECGPGRVGYCRRNLLGGGYKGKEDAACILFVEILWKKLEC